MCSDIVRSIGAAAEEAAVEAAWAQWGAITATAVPEGEPRVWTIVDPEALILVSIAVRQRERRLDDLLAGWARAGSSLVSVQRLKALAKHFPAPVQEQVGYFAQHAADAGDRRWRPHASERGADGFADRGKDFAPLRLLDGPGLMLRLRAGIGVGAKADLLTYLIGIQGASADLRALTVATGYSDRALRTAADEMALARFVRGVAGTPSAYRADPEAWMPLLGAGGGPPGVPRWQFWSVAFAFLAAVAAWEREASLHGWSCYVASSRARDLMELHGRRMRYLSAQLDSGDEARGVEYLDVFQETVQRIAHWTRKQLYEPS
jgi:hypothetical protein